MSLLDEEYYALQVPAGYARARQVQMDRARANAAYGQEWRAMESAYGELGRFVDRTEPAYDVRRDAWPFGWVDDPAKVADKYAEIVWYVASWLAVVPGLLALWWMVRGLFWAAR